MTIHAKYTPAWLIIKSMSQFRSILLAACSKRPEQQQTALTFRREKKHIFRTDVGFSWWVPIASSTHQYLQLHEHSYTHTHTQTAKHSLIDLLHQFWKRKTESEVHCNDGTCIPGYITWQAPVQCSRTVIWSTQHWLLLNTVYLPPLKSSHTVKKI